MAGYTRQSISQIQNGSDITAPPLNAEFNQILAAFNATTGHGHTGALGDSPAIPLATSVSGFLPAVHGGTGGKNNFATSNPTSTNDSSQNYAVGSLWINTSNKRIFICTSNASNAANWHEIVANTGTVFSPETTNVVDIGTTTHRYKDLYLSGNANVTGTTTANHIDTGTITSTGLGTFATIDANGGQVDGAVIGGNSASAITGTQITANSGFVGDVTGNVAGNVTSSGTSGFNNITASGTIQGAVTGNVAGNVTATTGTSQFNNVTVNGTLNMDGATSATIENLSAPVNANDAARKVDVDNAVSNLVASSPAALDTLNELAAAINDDASFSTTMTNSLATKLPLAGGTMSGSIAMGTSKITGIGDPTSTQDAVSKNYADTQDALKLNLSGGTLTGSIAMSNNTISGVPNPAANDQVSNKSYVDSILGSATSAATSASNAATSETNAANSASTAAGHAATATSAITNSQHFVDTYFISGTQPTGSNITAGDLWFDTTNNLMKVYGASGWQNAGSSVNGTAQRVDFTATSGQTTFSANYDTGYVDVYLNGVKLAPSDFTASDGANVVLASAAATGDTVSIVSFGTFQLADHYNKTQTDTLISDVEALALAGM